MQNYERFTALEFEMLIILSCEEVMGHCTKELVFILLNSEYLMAIQSSMVSDAQRHTKKEANSFASFLIKTVH